MFFLSLSFVVFLLVAFLFACAAVLLRSEKKMNIIISGHSERTYVRRSPVTDWASWTDLPVEFIIDKCHKE